MFVQDITQFYGDDVTDCKCMCYSPERELIRQQHEEIISQLNQRMAEKAR